MIGPYPSLSSGNFTFIAFVTPNDFREVIDRSQCIERAKSENLIDELQEYFIKEPTQSHPPVITGLHWKHRGGRDGFSGSSRNGCTRTLNSTGSMNREIVL
jgi:hypothetical protein